MIEFFIHRPIFATVVALVMILAGGICAVLLPIAQFPDMTPPQVSVSCSYTGASAQVVSDAVTTPIEEDINGAENMIYIASNSTSNGDSSVTVTFEVGTDQDIDAVNTQVNLQQAMPLLPEEVTKAGVTLQKVSNYMTLVVNLISPDGSRDEVFLGNYADIHLTDVFKRVPGVGKVTLFGLQKYAIRIWLDPAKLTSMGVTATDVVNAVQQQNQQVAAGQVGAPPQPEPLAMQYPVVTLGRLSDVSQFEQIVVRAEADGKVVRVKDVARVELGAESYNWTSQLNGQPSAAIGIYQLPDANAIDVAERIREAMKELAKDFPAGVDYTIPYDTTKFVRASLGEVVETLVIAIVLVVGVVFVFLQDWRATIIPVIAIPVALVGTFALLMAFGFSINTLSLFGLVLAIGLVVDDSIVVVENVQRQLQEGETDRAEATRKAMAEVRGPIIATTLVLMAVFVPCAFMPGLTGRLYNQFALTIAFSVGLSAINSLSLSPALCAVFLRPEKDKKFFLWRWFNTAFDRSAHGYKRVVQGGAKLWPIVVLGFAGCLVGAYLLLTSVPTAFVPEEDQGYFMVNIQAPDGATLDRTQQICDEVAEILKSDPGMEDIMTINGYSLLSGTVQPNAAFIIAILKPWDDRQDPSEHVQAIIGRCQNAFYGIEEGMVAAFNAPAIPGLGATGGFQFQVQDRQALGVEALAKATYGVIGAAQKRPELTGMFTSFTVTTPQVYLDIDRTKAMTLGLQMQDVFDTLQINLGSLYVNQFNKFGRVYRVYLQADADARAQPEDIHQLYVRNDKAEMIPLSAIAQGRTISGPSNIPHYNLYPSSAINGNAAPGYSSGQAIAAMEEIADDVLPEGMGYEWTGITYQQLKAGNLAPVIFGLALVAVFLFLAAQYESWTIPFVIILAVPLALLGAAGALAVRALDLDVYAQIGLVMLIGLAAKNAILIVEFACRIRGEGKSIVEAATEAARLRLRPILMTAFAFILGVLPLVLATGAGASSRHSLGTTVFGGMLVSTILSLLTVPVFYVVVETLREKLLSHKPAEASEHPTADEES
jgi:hydrophobe/amphiphile efflux-1 (HAE1) family protein